MKRSNFISSGGRQGSGIGSLALSCVVAVGLAVPVSVHALRLAEGLTASGAAGAADLRDSGDGASGGDAPGLGGMSAVAAGLASGGARLAAAPEAAPVAIGPVVPGAPEVLVHAVRTAPGGAAGDPGGSAIVSVAGGPQRSVAVGEGVVGAWVLVAVVADGVVLSDGQRRVPVGLRGGLSRSGGAVSPEGAGDIPVDADRPVDRALEPVPADLAALEAALALRPVRRGADLLGHEVSAVGGDLAPLLAAGLRPGDRLVTVNGLWFTPATEAAMRAGLRQGAGVELTLDRGRERLSLRLVPAG